MREFAIFQKRSESVLKKEEMSEADFQKLISIALSDLSIRRTLLENESRQLQNQMRTLEQEETLEKIEEEILAIERDYQHYLAFASVQA